MFVSATVLEVKPLLDHFKVQPIVTGITILSENTSLLITGVGMLETAVVLAKYINEHKPDLVVGLGVAGSYSTRLLPGSLVEIISEQYGDLGVDDHGTFIPASELGLIPKQKLEIKPAFPKLEKASGITVNQVAGSAEVIDQRRKLFNADVETMEGLALFKICTTYAIPSTQIRAISNMVEPRDRSKWKVDKAIITLNEFVLSFINSML